jgi:hypothetical protein
VAAQFASCARSKRLPPSGDARSEADNTVLLYLFFALLQGWYTDDVSTRQSKVGACVALQYRPQTRIRQFLK